MKFDIYDKKRNWVFERYINDKSVLISSSQTKAPIDLKYIEKI